MGRKVTETSLFQIWIESKPNPRSKKNVSNLIETFFKKLTKSKSVVDFDFGVRVIDFENAKIREENSPEKN